MKVLIAPDKFKDSLTSEEVCAAIAKGVHKSFPKAEIITQPLADGGEGTLEAIEKSLSLESRTIEVHDPLFHKIKAPYMYKGDMAFIEMSKASGLQLLNKEDRNCMYTTSLGTGELIKDALQHGAKNIYLFIGGSATNDAGIGIASALGYRFLDAHGNTLKPTGENLIKIDRIDNSKAILTPDVEFVVLCDVSNPMHGPNGAAYVYGAQKGASQSEIRSLDDGLKNYAHVIQQAFNMEVSNISGAGAAGGIAASMIPLFLSKLQRGIDAIIDIVKFEALLKEADFVITGEGKLDHQSLEGKVVDGVSGLCLKFSKSLGVLVGKIDLEEKQIKQLRAHQVMSVMDEAKDVKDAMNNASQHLESLSSKLIKSIYSSL
ncbi:glycerate kinase [Reichenbachiella versicolor]|uniref:glycerate kinase n=1 Tax=Reichenbachiella versicolor TaxID=1821036 RepID=UPI000D6E5604|nr:glycerate kinase [Reichenbachiella versicolor]